MRFVILSLVAWVVLTVFTVVFASSAKASEVRVLPKGIWLLLIALMPVLGSILYLSIGRPVGHFVSTQLAPDDDPEFLQRLAERLKNDDNKDDEGNV